MRKLKLQMQMSVDGFVAGPEGQLDWMTWTWWPLWVFALLGALPLPFRRPLAPAGRLSLATVAAATATHLMVFGGDRYHLPLVGFMVALSAAAFRGLTRGDRRVDRTAE